MSNDDKISAFYIIYLKFLLNKPCKLDQFGKLFINGFLQKNIKTHFIFEEIIYDKFNCCFNRFLTGLFQYFSKFSSIHPSVFVSYILLNERLLSRLLIISIAHPRCLSLFMYWSLNIKKCLKILFTDITSEFILGIAFCYIHTCQFPYIIYQSEVG